MSSASTYCYCNARSWLVGQPLGEVGYRIIMADNLAPLRTRPMEDRELVARAKLGDENGFAELYQRHNRRITSLCLRMLRNQAEGEELVQDTFVQAFRKLDTFRGDSAFSTWLHRIAVNLVLMKMRKHRISEVSVDEQQAGEEDPAATLFGCEDLRLRGAIERVDLEGAVADLAPGYRIVFLLHDIEGYDHGEISELLGCSEGCSKSQLHKARLKLRESLRQRYFPMEPPEYHLAA